MWTVLEFSDDTQPWSAERCREAHSETLAYWTTWARGVTYSGARDGQVRRAALTIHLLTYAPDGTVVAAPTTSVPERIGGSWNADYRFSWVRDASLSLSVLALVGQVKQAARYLDWMRRLVSSWGIPFQVLYGVTGQRKLKQHALSELQGFRGSKPVNMGNHAFRQRQLGSLGFLADCVLNYLEHGGEWKPEYWDLVRQVADYSAHAWQQPDNSIWELSVKQQYLSSKVMSWVALDRACKIANRTGHATEVSDWQEQMTAIRDEIMDRGWSDHLGAFRQRYEAENLDASALLIPLMGFLPVDHPRVKSTVDRLIDELTIDGLMYRFRPSDVPKMEDLPVGEFEGAFLPCTLWLASYQALVGRAHEAESLLDRVDAVAGPTGLLGEGLDPRTDSFMGNFPLLFSHATYVHVAQKLTFK